MCGSRTYRSAANRPSAAFKSAVPSPAAENMLGAAWSACFMGAIELAASQSNVKLPAEVAVNAEIKLN